MVKFDPHQLIIETVERSATYFMQIGRADASADIITNGTYTELVYAAASAKNTAIIFAQTGRAPVGSKLWARCKCPGQNTAYLDFYIGIHEYQG